MPKSLKGKAYLDQTFATVGHTPGRNSVQKRIRPTHSPEATAPSGLLSCSRIETDQPHTVSSFPLGFLVRRSKCKPLLTLNRGCQLGEGLAKDVLNRKCGSQAEKIR